MRKENKNRRKRVTYPALITAMALSIFISSIISSSVTARLIQSESTSTPITATAMSSKNDGLKNVGTYIQTGVSASEDMTIEEIASLVSDSVVEIRTEAVSTGNRMSQFITSGAGSGVIISSDGYIVTNYHVIDGAQKIAVTLKSGVRYDAVLVGVDSDTDIAVIKIEANNLQPAVLGDSSKLKVGSLAIAVGNPLGQLGGTVTDGIISALDREIEVNGQYMNLMQTNAAINPGNSGGGLFNGQGELVGIVSAKSSGEDVEGLGFAIPINDAKDVIDQIIDYGYVKGRISMNYKTLDISDARLAMFYRLSRTGLYVYEVEENSPEAVAGLQTADRIVSINGAEVNSTAELKKEMNQLSAGDKITMVIDRFGKELTLQWTAETK